MDPKPEQKKPEEVIIPTGENYFEHLVTLSEATILTSKHPDELLRMGAGGKIQYYFPISVEKIELGKLRLVPTEENIESSICENRPDWCAIPVSPYLEDILKNGPDYFKPIREKFPQGLTFRLGVRQVGALLAGGSVYVKYGVLPNGYYFKVVSSMRGLEIRRENILLQKESLDLIGRVKVKEPPSETPPEKVLSKKSKPDKLKVISVPAGTRWSDIRVCFENRENVGIIVNKKKPIQRNFRTMGFEDLRSGKPNKGWKVFILLALGSGKIEETIKNMPKTMCDLNKSLCRVFPNVKEGNAFASYRRVFGWTPNLRFSLLENLANKMR